MLGPGVYRWTASFEHVIAELRKLILDWAGAERDTQVEGGPLLPRSVLQRTGYFSDFADQCGMVSSYDTQPVDSNSVPNISNVGRDTADCLRLGDFVLPPAACYHVYPTLCKKLTDGPCELAVHSFCYRNESSPGPLRLRLFRMCEMVRLGTPSDVKIWLDQWRRKSIEGLGELGVEAELVAASDPFFGRGSRVKMGIQRALGLKSELVAKDRPGVAVASVNYHSSHFGEAFRIEAPDGTIAHSACVAFGLERLALTLAIAAYRRKLPWLETALSVIARKDKLA